jgi:putative endonuclease
MKNKTNSYKLGIFAEKICLFLLFCQGYKILANRYKCFAGEIDIIALHKKHLIFIEVKARIKQQNIEEILLAKQIHRIKSSADYFISKNQHLSTFPRRFDFIQLSFFSFQHYHNFF